MALALAVDIGATKSALALVDDRGRVERRAQVATPIGYTAAETWAPVAAAAHALLEVLGPADLAGVGIGSAGPIDPVAGTISPVMIPAWRDFPVVREATRFARDSPVALIGDGVCAAIGEHWVGAGQHARTMLGVVVSSGIGGGLVLDGRVHVGPTGNAGHVGHVVVDADGAPCDCGGRGCAETIGSGPSMVMWARAAGWRPAGDDPTAAGLADAARSGDRIALAAFARGGRAVAAMVASVAAVCDLDLVVVGGGVAEAGEVLFAPVRAALAEHAGLEFVRRVRVQPAFLGGDAGLVGAAALIHQAAVYGVPGGPGSPSKSRRVAEDEPRQGPTAQP